MLCEYIEMLLIQTELLGILAFVWGLIVSYRTKLVGWEKDKKMLLQAGIVLAIPMLGYLVGYAFSCLPLDWATFQLYLFAGAKAAVAVLGGTMPIAAKAHRTEAKNS